MLIHDRTAAVLSDDFAGNSNWPVGDIVGIDNTKETANALIGEMVLQTMESRLRSARD
jgi:hypothetical protein